MPARQHIVRLSPEDRRTLQQLTRTGSAPVLAQTHARILLLADPGTTAPTPSDRAIAAALGVCTRTVARVRERYCTQGLTAATARKDPTRVYRRKLDGAGEAKLIELACGPAPLGSGRWTLRLLGDRLVELGVVEAIAPNTVRTTLKQTRCNHTG